MKYKKKLSSKESFSLITVPKILSVVVDRREMKKQNLKYKNLFFYVKSFSQETILNIKPKEVLRKGLRK